MTTTSECNERHKGIKAVLGVLVALMGLMVAMVAWALAAEQRADQKASEAIRAVEVQAARSDEWKKAIQADVADIKAKQDRTIEMLMKMPRVSDKP